MKKLFKYIPCLTISLFFALLQISCDNDVNPDPAAPLSILSIEPLTARAGDTIRIMGTGFSTTRWKNKITFFKTIGLAGVAASTETELKVIIPSSVGNGPIEIVVGNRKALSDQSFIFNTSLGAPEITSIDPAHGLAGSEVVLTGINFVDSASIAEIFFGESSANVLEFSDTRLKVRVPEGLAQGSVPVKAIRAALSSNKMNFVLDSQPKDVKATYWADGLAIYKGTITPAGVSADILYGSADNVAAAAGVDFNPIDEKIYFIGASMSSSAMIFRAPADGSGPVEELYTMEQLNSFFPAYDIAVDPAQSTLYTAAIGTNDVGEGVDRIIKANYADPSAPVEILYEIPTGGGDIVGLKISGTKLYWTESISRRIMEGTIDGLPPKVLFDQTDNLSQPYNIAIDVGKQKIFIYDIRVTSESVPAALYAGNLDGSGLLVPIVSEGEFLESGFDIELDIENQRVIWTTSKGSSVSINRCTYEGSDPQSLFTGIPLVGAVFFDVDIR